MEVAGICQICGKPLPKLFSCSLCGKLICILCQVNGACKDCLAGRSLKGKMP